MEAEDPFDIGDIKITDGMYVRASQLVLDARMTDTRSARLLAALPDGAKFMLKVKFLREWNEGYWVVEDKFDPVHAERKKGHGIVEVSRNTKPGALTGIDKVFYQNAYPVTTVLYGQSRQRPRPCQPGPNESWRTQLRGQESCGAL